MSLQVRTEDQAETDRLWDALIANGGEESRAAGSRTAGACPADYAERLLELMGDPDKDGRAARWSHVGDAQDRHRKSKSRDGG